MFNVKGYYWWGIPQYLYIFFSKKEIHSISLQSSLSSCHEYKFDWLSPKQENILIEFQLRKNWEYILPKVRSLLGLHLHTGTFASFTKVNLQILGFLSLPISMHTLLLPTLQIKKRLHLLIATCEKMDERWHL